MFGAVFFRCIVSPTRFLRQTSKRTQSNNDPYGLCADIFIMILAVVRSIYILCARHLTASGVYGRVPFWVGRWEANIWCMEYTNATREKKTENIGRNDDDNTHATRGKLFTNMVRCTYVHTIGTGERKRMRPHQLRHCCGCKKPQYLIMCFR